MDERDPCQQDCLKLNKMKKRSRLKEILEKLNIDSQWKFRKLKKGKESPFKYEDITSREIGTTDWTRIWFSLFIGLVCGFVGVLFKSTVNSLGRFTYLAAIGDKSAYYSLPRWSLLIFLPAVTFVSAWIVSRFAPDAAGTGSSTYINAFHFKNAVIKLRTTIVKFFASSSILGCGTSGGFEGPIVLLGSGTGSWLSKKFNFAKKDSHIYMVTGAAAGIASVFQAPLGGALTSIEMLYREDYETRALVPALLASVTGFFVATCMHSSSFVIQTLTYNFNGIQEIPSYIILTFFCSGAGWGLVKVFDLFKETAEKSSIPNFLFPFFGSIGVALLGLVFPHVLGPRFSILLDVINERPGVMIVFAIFAAKFAATCFAIGTGGSGGVFGPSLLIGGLLGIGTSQLLTALNFPLPVPAPEAMMLVGMAGFFAAVSKAPFGSVIMVCEIAGTFKLLPPLIIVCLTTIVLTKSFTIYKTQVENRFKSPAHSNKLEERFLSGMLVYDFMENKIPVEVSSESTIGDLVEDLKGNESIFPLVIKDKKNRIKGLVKLEKLIDYKYVREYPETTSIMKVADPTAYVCPGDDLYEASMKMLEYSYDRIPVVSPTDPSRIIGRINRQDIFRLYAKIR